MMYGSEAEERIRQENKQIQAWQADLRVSEQLDTGIEQGLTFLEYQTETGCPNCLRDRYVERQRRSGIAPHSVKPEEDLFLKGFNYS